MAVSLKYCQNTLKINSPNKDFEMGARIKEDLHNKRMELTKGNFGVNKEHSEKVTGKFKKGNKRNYDFLVKSGDLFKETSFKYCQRMFREERFLEEFKETVLHMIFKWKKGNTLRK